MKKIYVKKKLIWKQVTLANLDPGELLPEQPEVTQRSKRGSPQ